MTLYTIMPDINLNDPEQTVTEFNKAIALGEAFVSKYASDCPKIAVVEIRVVAYVEYARPIVTTV